MPITATAVSEKNLFIVQIIFLMNKNEDAVTQGAALLQHDKGGRKKAPLCNGSLENGTKMAVYTGGNRAKMGRKSFRIGLFKSS